ncbi:extracellular mutant protein 11-domain-containing protein [Aspergillus avenaceus]|uniref:Extracellular mutant protein 11-domain-containing protein n=1 Tax=Aspergillus avenaceus TaxID=36643 RepID=A0A5N6TY93_ASPAV|nr:extracellular mutant protein 11-domain-containing protein [Aspergillus avenaceus]
MASAPFASAFSLPVPSSHLPQSTRVARYEPRKRKKDDDDWGNEDDGIEGETTDAGSEFAPSAPSLILTPEEAHQYRVAGLSFDKELPGGNFPHAPAKDEGASKHKKFDIQTELSNLKPPIYPPQSAAYQGNLRWQHLAVLSSILHRSLLNNDYIRAGRAWGLILREESHGHPIDARTDGRWGIGAEILLRRGHQTSNLARDDDAPKTAFSKLPFTRKGFEDAKHYYERLVIQHPFRKAAPDSTSPLHFYPAMFGLWVYVTQEESNASRQDIWDDEEASGENSADEDAAFDLEGHENPTRKQRSLIAEVRTTELNEAQKIAARMDEVLVSPPYSDSPELLELRGMVSLWIGDLLVSCLPYKQRDGYESEDNDSAASEDFHESIQERRELRLATEKKQSEIEKANEFFDKAKSRSKGMTSTLEDFHIDDNASCSNYVHSKEAGKPRPAKIDISNQSRQKLAEQARVDVPKPKLGAPVPLPINRQVQFDQYGSQSHAPDENNDAKKDMFDTDVEGIDDSTIAATSVMGVEDIPYRYSPARDARQPAANTNSFQPFQQSRRPFDPHWYDNFGDKAMKSAGFGSDDIDNESQLTSVAGDDEDSDGTNESVVAIRRRPTDEPLSKRLQNFWNASRKTYPKPETQVHVDQSKIPTFNQSTTSEVKLANQALPVTAPRKVTLPPNTTTTPRTRFSPPKPTLLEKLDMSTTTPTRRTPGPRPQRHTRATSIDPPDSVENAGFGYFTDDYKMRDSVQSITAFDVTNLNALDDDDDDGNNNNNNDNNPINDPFSRRASIIRRPTPEKSNPKKRQLEPDYPPEVLYQKQFSELQAEPFDHTPAAPTPTPPLSTTPETPGDKISHLMNISADDRRNYFSNLSMDEWEDCGDLIIEQFSQMVTKMKDLRHARRKTAAMFEAEIKRRNDEVEGDSSDLSRKLDEMRTGGAEVLRGRTP